MKKTYGNSVRLSVKGADIIPRKGYIRTLSADMNELSEILKKRDI